MKNKAKKPESTKVNVKHLANSIAAKLRPYCDEITINGETMPAIAVVGSIRRGEVPNDIDIVLIPRDVEKVNEIIAGLGKKVSWGPEQKKIITRGISVEFYFAKPEYWGAMMLNKTGPAGSNIGLSMIAKKLGFTKLNAKGLWIGPEDALVRVAGETEASIFEKLHRPYTPPHLRGLSKQEKEKRGFSTEWKGKDGAKKSMHSSPNVFEKKKSIPDAFEDHLRYKGWKQVDDFIWTIVLNNRRLYFSFDVQVLFMPGPDTEGTPERTFRRGKLLYSWIEKNFGDFLAENNISSRQLVKELQQRLDAALEAFYQRWLLSHPA